MVFNNLAERMLYYRGLTDYRLIPNSIVLIMLDGRAFSASIKKYFKKPFDDKFINMMNETAKYLCENVQGCKFAYVQSDEITLVVTDYDTPESDSFFGYRLEKITSICASLAASKFNQMMAVEELYRHPEKDLNECIMQTKLHEFDCKAWNVPTYNDMFAWLLYRQNDCIKNSKQQSAQSYLSHKELCGKSADEQIEMLLKDRNIDWNQFDDGKKYGRFIYKKEFTLNAGTDRECIRNKFSINDAFLLNNPEGKERFINMNLIPKQ